MINQQD